MTYESTSAAGQPRLSRPVNVLDVVGTVVLVLASLALGMFFTASSIVLAIAPSVNTFGLGLALYGSGALVLLGAAVSIVQLVRRRLAFWVPLASSTLAFIAWIVGTSIAVAG
ncbi:hypothetical protein [Naasia lichenicola]|uniref:Uncharacterized protein n=1 Tax=Naasia lichenicola TaxID=2565933 RepID=A0A4S4FLT7_9MICO|nr:hypothetical protein [Naasia lichenicola]THG30872.1 hypothetical protein E6C64_09595 [Naasia lichenicola]